MLSVNGDGEEAVRKTRYLGKDLSSVDKAAREARKSFLTKRRRRTELEEAETRTKETRKYDESYRPGLPYSTEFQCQTMRTRFSGERMKERVQKAVLLCPAFATYLLQCQVAMDRADVEIEEEEDGVAKSSWSAAFLRRSWWIGKRLAITGAAITSAPVIIPFLFVLSTLGIAFSFPFGVYLAGYVCTDKFMRVLLPLPPLIEGGLDVDRGDEVVLDEEQWEKREILEGERERSVMEAGVEGEVEGVRRGDRIGEEDEMVKGVELRNDAAVVKELRKCDSAKEVRAGVEKVGEDVTAAFESSESPKSPYTVVVMAAKEASDKREYEPPNLSSEHLSLVELGGEGKINDTSVTEEQMEDCGEEEKRLRVANRAMTKDKELSKEGNTVVPRLKSDYVLSAVIVPSEDENAEILESFGSIKHRSFGKSLSAAAIAVGVTGSHSHDEISSLQRTHNEEELWDQIFSMRAIVGYKATLQPSLGEELIALYLFIGAEPSVSLKDSTDIVEISNGLQFLKSVVGVK